MNIETARIEAPAERRRIDRLGVRYLRFYSPVPGSILNMSREGMCLETVAEFQRGVEYLFRIRHGSLLFEIRGLVQWCSFRSTLATSTGVTLQLFRSGIAFRDPIPIETFEFLTTQMSNT